MAVKLAKHIAILALASITGLLAFALYWGCAYRLPRTAPILVDLRQDKTGKDSVNDRSFMLCAALANNPHGYPGHCYIIWDRRALERLEYADSDGFVPAGPTQLIPSLYSDVRGVMADHAIAGNMRNLDYIVVLLDRAPYERARAVRARFMRDTTFHTGVRDCVSYVNEIARIAGLKTSPGGFVYPLDYVERLKKLNSQMQTASNAKE